MARIISQPSGRAGAVARHTTVILLAAGASRRLGRAKQTAGLRGVPLVRHTASLALALRPARVVVVLGAAASRATAALRGLPVVTVRAHGWRAGMAASLAAGLRGAPRCARHLAVLSVDQWAVTRRDLERLWAAAGRRPAAAEYAHRRGIPAIFPSDWRAPLRRLRGDRGARDLLQGAGVRGIAMPSAALDLDTRQDLATLRRWR